MQEEKGDKSMEEVKKAVDEAKLANDIILKAEKAL